MTRKLWILSPIALLAFSWTLTIGIGALPFLNPEHYGLALYFLAREELGPELISWAGILWLGVALMFFVALSGLTLLGAPDRFDARPHTDLDRMARRVFRVNCFCLGVTLAWIAVSAAQMGGLGALVAQAQSNALALRDQMLENKLFSGMRLLYGALPATGAMACVLLAAGRKFGTLSPHARRLLLSVALTDLVALTLLPIIMSQRILLLHLLMASYFGICMVHQRIVALPQLVLGAGLFLLIWILRESVTNPTLSDHGAVELGLQKLVFYASNDLLNTLQPFTRDFDHTLGFFSFRFLLILTQTEGSVLSLIPSRLEGVEEVRGGGEWSMLTTPYVDFGVAGALVLLAFFAIATAVTFHRGHFSLTAAGLYAHMAAGFMLSTHVQYFTNINFVVILCLTGFIGASAPLRSLPALRPTYPLARRRSP
ncbi:O-antigen polymerase (plasmid) [Thioclava litoralis]|uniref:O-antigen polymerase n=1 Tax=Thioclava litoralis TaxID=3076557 RepID=A0ABZ1E2D4_9RHOB|nr:O-antigen polymerase [Thioclava sp. FTW29]